jgi:hypothetical protein
MASTPAARESACARASLPGSLASVPRLLRADWRAQQLAPPAAVQAAAANPLKTCERRRLESRERVLSQF